MKSKNQNNSNKPINHSIWVIFDLEWENIAYWFDTLDDAETYLSKIDITNLSKPIKYCKDF